MLYFNTKRALDIFFNHLKVQGTSNFVSRDNNTFVINMNEVSYYVQLDALKRLIDIYNMSTGVLNEVFHIVNAYGDYNLFT